MKRSTICSKIQHTNSRDKTRFIENL